MSVRGLPTERGGADHRRVQVLNISARVFSVQGLSTPPRISTVNESLRPSPPCWMLRTTHTG